MDKTDWNILILNVEFTLTDDNDVIIIFSFASTSYPFS